MGADTATLLAKDYKFKGLVHIEGNITGDDLFITSQARNAVELGRFSEWFIDRCINRITLLYVWLYISEK
jgi:hypothetical protein